jgi:hypothetical protein
MPKVIIVPRALRSVVSVGPSRARTRSSSDTGAPYEVKHRGPRPARAAYKNSGGTSRECTWRAQDKRTRGRRRWRRASPKSLLAGLGRRNDRVKLQRKHHGRRSPDTPISRYAGLAGVNSTLCGDWEQIRISDLCSRGR